MYGVQDKLDKLDTFTDLDAVLPSVLQLADCRLQML